MSRAIVLQQSALRTSSALNSQRLHSAQRDFPDIEATFVFRGIQLLQYPEASCLSLPMPQKKKQLPIVLSIAGHDPSSGAGITADIKTIAAHGCYGVTCITALTVQSTRGVKRVDPVEGQMITETLEHLMDDLDIAAVKIGMLGSAEAAKAVAAFLKRHSLRLVVLDPIIRSSSGARLIFKGGGCRFLKTAFFPVFM